MTGAQMLRERSATTGTADGPVAPARSRRRRYDWRAIGFVGPALVVLLVFRIAPVVYGAYLSLTNWDGFSTPQFTGFANYAQMAHDEVLRSAVVNNLLLLVSIPVWVFLPLLIAVLIHEGVWLGKVLKIAYIIPTLVSPALLGLTFTLVLGIDGPVNKVLSLVGLGGLRHQWLADPNTVLWTFIAIMIWASFGVGVLFYSSGLASIDASLYDAAAIDGANWWQRLRNITVPHLRPVTQFWSVVVVISSFTATFPLLYTLTGGGPGHRSTTIDLYIFQLAFQDQSPSYATAIGMATFVVVFVLILVQLRLMRRRGDPS